MAGPVFQHDGEVAVVLPDGSPGYVPKSAVRDVVAANGRVLGEEEAQALQGRSNFEAQYDGTVEGAVAPVIAGAARGASLGLSDAALGTFGGERVRRKLLDYQDYAPKASMAGEVAGVVVPSLFGEEAGLTGAVSKAGKGLERAVGEGLGGGFLARSAGRIAGGGLEGGLYAAGKAEGDAALRDEHLTTEKALAAVGHGAVFGGGANVLLGGAGAGLTKLLGREEGAAAGLATRAEASAQRESTGLGDTLQKASDVKTIKALGGSAGDLAALERSTPGGFRKVAQDIRGDLETSTGKSIGLHNKESLHEYATKRVEELGDKLGGMLKKLDEAGTGVAPDVNGFAARVRQELIEPNIVPRPPGPVLPGEPAFIVKPGQSQVVHSAESWLKEVEGAFGNKPPTFSEWQQARIALDKQINFAARNASPEMGALKQIRGVMEKELETSGEAAAKNMGGAFADEYQATKSLYASVRKAQDLTERGVARELANNSFGLGATIGAATGLATGGPLGSIAMGLAGKVVKDRGDMMAADLLHRAANLAGVRKLASQTDNVMSKSISSLLGTKAIPTGAEAVSRSRRVAAPLGVALTGDLHKDFDRVRAQAVDLSANPMKMTDRVAAALGPEAAKSPAVAQAVTNVMLGDVAYLNSKLPPARIDTNTLQPQLQPVTRASDSEKHEYLEAAKALDDPTILLKQAKEGSLTPITVETIKERRPELYDDMRTQIFQSLTTSTTELPYDTRIQLGTLLDFPTDQTLAPDFVRDIQATYTASEKAGVEPPPPQLTALDVSSSLMTSTESVGSEGKAR